MIERPVKVLLIGDERGIYIPQSFATLWDKEERTRRVIGVTDEGWKILEAGPDHPEYWDAWLYICDLATVIDANGVKYSVYQDGDCWLIPDGMTWDEEADDWRWPYKGATPNDN